MIAGLRLGAREQGNREMEAIAFRHDSSRMRTAVFRKESGDWGAVMGGGPSRIAVQSVVH